MTNDKGEVLANVHENVAFQEVYDFHGTEKMRHRLDRKKDQIANQYNSRSHLFQKVYYSRGLLLEDEKQLRAAFNDYNSQHDAMDKYTKIALFAGFFPACFQLSRQMRPTTIGFFAVGYVAFWKYGVQPFFLQRFQNSINSAAAPFAEKYGIKAE